MVVTYETLYAGKAYKIIPGQTRYQPASNVQFCLRRPTIDLEAQVRAEPDVFKQCAMVCVNHGDFEWDWEKVPGSLDPGMFVRMVVDFLITATGQFYSHGVSLSA